MDEHVKLSRKLKNRHTYGHFFFFIVALCDYNQKAMSICMYFLICETI